MSRNTLRRRSLRWTRKLTDSMTKLLKLPPPLCDTVIIPESVDLKVLADGADIDIDSLLELNPELVHTVTPPNIDGGGYPLRSPREWDRYLPKITRNYPRAQSLHGPSTLSDVAKHLEGLQVDTESDSPP